MIAACGLTMRIGMKTKYQKILQDSGNIINTYLRNKKFKVNHLNTLQFIDLTLLSNLI